VNRRAKESWWIVAIIGVLAGIGCGGPTQPSERGINNRLTKLLHYFARTYPEEGWSKFLKAGVPRWERIAFGGHSQGGQAAATLAKLHLCSRVVFFSSPGDVVGSRAAPWLSTHATPSDHYYGLADDRDITGPYADQLIVWEELGMRRVRRSDRARDQHAPVRWNVHAHHGSAAATWHSGARSAEQRCQ
jgi:pimeloyl-ACP methyl ester carboxylesterase